MGVWKRFCPPLLFLNNFFNKTAINTNLKIFKENLILHILTKFHDDDDVNYTKIMAILSTGAFQFLYKKETAVIFECLDQQPPCIISSVHRGMFSISGDTMSTSGAILSTSGDVQYIGGYHDSFA